MTLIVRDYTSKDEDMLTVCSVIIEQAIIHKTFLISKRSSWADPFFENIKTTINNAFSNYLGLDSSKGRRLATQALYAIQNSALKSISEFKVQIDVDFSSNKERLKEIHTQLGFSSYLKKAQKKDQEALVSLLFTFKTNMTSSLLAEITSAGTDAAIIYTISDFAQTLKDANVTQETFKGTVKELTQEGVIALNAIYNQVISVAKIAYKFYNDNHAVRDEFSFSKNLRKLNPHPIPIPPTS